MHVAVDERMHRMLAPLLVTACVAQVGDTEDVEPVPHRCGSGGGGQDSGVPDSGPDSGVRDAGVLDSGVPEMPSVDAGPIDAGTSSGMKWHPGVYILFATFDSNSIPEAKSVIDT